LRDLIKEVMQQNGRWRVVASVRKFDLRYSPELRELFKGDPPSKFSDPELSGIRHLNVPTLDQDELSQIEPQSPELYSLIVNAQSELRDLVSVPFNLRLIADLIGNGMDPAHFSPVRTQLQLLDRYWQHRVLRNDGYRDAREDILRRACGEMVEQRRLRVDRTAVAIPDSSPRLNDLLSNYVLAEWRPSPAAAPDSYVLTFSHHVLFDYSVERLLLRGDPAQVITRFAKAPEMVLVVRPSLELYFENSWKLDKRHERFWDVVFRFISESRIPEVGKLVGPSVAARLANQPLDFEPLFELLKSPQESRQKVADAALRHLIGALCGYAGRRKANCGTGGWTLV
jgi:hypothetical protein